MIDSIVENKETKHRHKVSFDHDYVRRVFRLKALTEPPKERVQRDAFAKLLPEIYMLRTQGYGFEAITSAMTSVDFKLSVSTVRCYYYEMLTERQEECKRCFDDQLLILKDVEKQTAALDLELITERTKLIMANKFKKHSSSFDADFYNINKTVEQSYPIVNKKDSENFIVENKIEEIIDPKDNFNFGLIDSQTSNDQKQAKPVKHFFDMDEPTVPTINVPFDSVAMIESAKPTGKKIKVASPQGVHTLGQEKLVASPQGVPTLDQEKSVASLHCLPLKPDQKIIENFAGVEPFVYENGILEHPSIPGLMLNKEERTYGAYLEICDDDGVVRLETHKERMFRIKWKKPFINTPSHSSHQFVEMDMSLFKKN